MLTTNVGKLTKRILIVGIAAAVLVCSGLAGILSDGADQGKAITTLTAEHVYAEDGDYASQVIPDEKLASVIRMLVNYFEETGGKNLYTLIASDEYKTLFEKHGTRITDYIDPAVPGTKSLVELYDKPISQAWMEDYNGVIDLTEYTEITDLTGLNAAIKVTSVTIPKNCTAVPGKAFESMMKLSVVLVPSTVTAIGDGAFEKCESLKSLLIYDPKTTIVIAPVDEQQRPVANIIYLKGITSIGNSAFKACKGMKTAYFGEDDAEYMAKANIQIGSGAFSSCTSLKNVTVPKGTLGTGVFSSCLNLTSIVFDDSYTKIPDNTLSEIGSNLTITFPSNLEEIGAYAVSGTDIQDMNIESCTALKVLDEHTFSNSKIRMDAMDLSKCEQLTTIGREAFAGCTFTKGDLEFIMPHSVTVMGCGTFYMARGMKEILISSMLTEIPDAAFFYCYELENVWRGDSVETIGAHAFEFCGRLNDYRIWYGMANVKTIGDYAFAHCMPAADDVDEEGNFKYGMDGFTFRDSVTSVGKSVFEDNFMMTDIHTGKGMTEIPDRFHICETSTSPTWADFTCTDPISGKEFTYPVKSNTDTAYKNFRDRFKYKKNISVMSSLNWVYTSHSKIQSIGDYAFYGNTSLTGFENYTNRLVLPPDLKTIGKYAFAGCARTEGSNADLEYYGIEYVTIPDAIESIGEYAFNNDYALQTVRFPEDLEEIPAHCFDGSGHNNKYKEEGAKEATDHYHGLWCISDLRQVKSIGDYAFNNCYCLYQYRYNWDDTGVGHFSDLEFGRNLTYLGRNAFTNTAIKSASSLIYTQIESVGISAFDGCRNLTTVYCPDTLMSIGDYAFRSCPKLDTMSFPVYASLSASMIAKNEQNITMTPTLGRYLNTRFKVPVGQTISLPANALARRVTDKISQVYVDGPNAGKDVEIDQADPQYFTVTSEKNQYRITGGDNEVIGTAVRISATVPFTDSSSKVMNIDYPLDVVNTHADPQTLAFDQSKIKIGGASAGTIFEKDGETYLYVNKNKIGNVLTLVLDAQSTDKDFPGIITDDALWSSSDSSVLALKADTVAKTTGADKTTTTAQFEIKTTGEAVASGGFDDTEAAEKPAIKIHVCVIDPIKSIDFTLESTGKDHKNMSSISMPEGQTDKMDAVLVYTTEDDERDSLVYTSADPTVVSIDKNGNITALKPGKARITVESVTGSTRRDITVTVVEKGSYIAPLFVSITGPVENNKGIAYCDAASTFKATCLPDYASQGVKWTISSADATLDEQDGDAYVTGVNPNKTVTLTAQATDGTTAQSAKTTLQVMTTRRAETVEFKEAPPFIKANDVKSLVLSSNVSQTNGIIRTPADSWDKVTFTSSDPTILTLGASQDKCTRGSVTLSGQSPRLYYMGFRNGTATITARTSTGSESVIVVTIVTAPVTSLSCTEPAVTLLKSRTAQMKLEVTPEISTDPITYTSSDEKIVTVNGSGLMTAVAPGYATVTAKSRVNGRSTPCRVTVLGNGQTVTVGTANYTVYKDGTLTFTYMYNVGKTVTVPNTVKISGNSYKVTRIAKSALRYNSTVTKVIIGTNVTWIGADAFNNNPNLKLLEVRTQKLKTLGKRVVKDCKRGMTIKLKKAKFKAYKSKFKKSGVPAKTKYKKF